MKQTKNNWKDYMLLHTILLLYSLGSVCSKIAAGHPFLSLPFILAYGMVLVIMFSYALVWQQVLKRFDLTVAFANKAVVIIWGIVWGVVFFHEKITWNMMAGALIIMIGIGIVVRGNDD